MSLPIGIDIVPIRNTHL